MINANFEQHWAEIVVSMGFLTLLIANLFSRNIRAKQTAKYFFIWLLMGLCFIAIFSYRFEIKGFFNRITSELNPTKPKIIQQNNQEKIIIKAANDGHYYLRATINQQNILFLIDTGATNISLSTNDAKKIGINLQKLKFNKIYQTANGQSFGANIILNEIIIANKVFSNINASVNQGNEYQSLLGISFLKQLKKYEFQKDELILTL